MSEIISGKEAKLAWGGGERVEYYKKERDEWFEVRGNTYVTVFDTMDKFRLMPRTITINEIEVPAPFEPKEGDTVFVLDNSNQLGFSTFTYNSEFYHVNFGAWRTEDEIKQVLEVLRGVLNVK